MNCEYCNEQGVSRIKNPDNNEDLYVCDGCWYLLKTPVTALPLIRGHLTMQLKGKMLPIQLDQMVNKFMEMLSEWKPRD